ncbi:MAG TPA: ubiquinol-cytochrome C chaperone family protein [Beijerinckiaceae bacterium]|jgi:cytochrome b pre-mRNA-processing protein 3
MILRFFRRDERRDTVAAFYARISDASRQPGLYRSLGVPDTIEGRFECVCLHVLLVLRRLNRLPPPANELAQDLTDCFFRELDLALRETGVGDMGISKRMKKLAQAYYGRVQAYDPALEARDAGALAAALSANMTEGVAAEGLAAYVLQAEDRLAAQDLDALLREGPAFPAPAE